MVESYITMMWFILLFKEMEREIAEGKDDMVIHRLRRYLLERDNRENY